MVREGTARNVVLYTWDAAPEFVRAAREIGVAGVILKTRSADVLVDCLERIVAGEHVGFEDGTHQRMGSRVVELSDRESEVLALIARGPDQRPDRRGAVPLDRDGEDVRQAPLRQARRPQPGPGRGRRLVPPADATRLPVSARPASRSDARPSP